MAGNVNRTTTIGLDASNAVQGIDDLKKSSEDLFTKTAAAASKQTSSREEEAKKIQQLLVLDEARSKQQAEAARLALERTTQNKIAALDPEGIYFEHRKRDALKEQKEELEKINRLHKEQAFTIKEAQTMAKEKYQDVDSSGGSGRGKRIAGGLGRTGAAMLGGAGAAAMLSAIPLIGGALGALFNNAKSYEDSQRGLQAMTGRQASLGGALPFGMGTAEYADMQRQVASTRGVGGVGLEKDVLSQIATEKAFGLGQGQLTNLAGFERMGGGSPMELVQQFAARAARSKLWDIEVGSDGKIKGFAALGEKMGDLNSLMGKETEISEKGATGRRSMELMEMFGSLGGGWEDSRAMGRMMDLDQTIRGGGGNEFLEAKIQTEMLRQDPSLDPLGLSMKRREGILGEGNIEAILNVARKIGGESGDRAGLTALDMETGQKLNMEALVNLYESRKGLFKGKGGEVAMSQLEELGVTEGQIKGKGAAATGGINVFDAFMKDFSAKAGSKMANSIEKPMKEFALGAVNTFGASTDKMTDKWAAGVDKMVVAFVQKMTGVDVSKPATKEDWQEEPLAQSMYTGMKAYFNKYKTSGGNDEGTTVSKTELARRDSSMQEQVRARMDYNNNQ